MPSSSRRFWGRDIQTYPLGTCQQTHEYGRPADLVCLMIQAIASVVHLLADMMISPSFSLDSSSITTIGWPCAKAASTSSIESKENSARCGSSSARTGRHGGVEPLSFRREDEVATGIVVYDSKYLRRDPCCRHFVLGSFRNAKFRLGITRLVICFFYNQHQRSLTGHQSTLSLNRP